MYMLSYDDIRAEAVKKLDLESLPEDVQNDVLSKIGSLIAKRIALDFLSVIPEEEKSEFKSLYEKGDVKKLDAFVRKHVPSPEYVVMNAIERVVADFRAKVDSE